MATSWDFNKLDFVVEGDSRELLKTLPDNGIDIVVTSPPYWGQRTSAGVGDEEDPREYIYELSQIFRELLPKMKESGILWLNIGDAYNTPVNWRQEDHVHSTLGAEGEGLSETNSAYVKNRSKRKAFTDKNVPWLTYGNLLALPYRLITEMSNDGWLFRGEVIWKKRNPMPEGRCRRPHRAHEPIYLFAKSERHNFRTTPPVKSVWEFGNERIAGEAHYSRFPSELPRRCIDAYGITGQDVVVLDPFSGSGTTGLVAIEMGCKYIGFEIDPIQVKASNERIAQLKDGPIQQVIL
jgi:DNA modification methylase